MLLTTHLNLNSLYLLLSWLPSPHCGMFHCKYRAPHYCNGVNVKKNKQLVFDWTKIAKWVMEQQVIGCTWSDGFTFKRNSSPNTYDFIWTKDPKLYSLHFSQWRVGVASVRHLEAVGELHFWCNWHRSATLRQCKVTIICLSKLEMV